MSLIKKTAVDLDISEEIVSKVISSTYEETTKALKVHNSVELSGFGIISMSPTKILKHLPRYISFLDKCVEEQKQNPSPKNYDRLQQVEQSVKNLKYRYEQIKGEPPTIMERG